MRTWCPACPALVVLGLMASTPAEAALIGSERGMAVLAAGAAFALPAVAAGFYAVLRQAVRALGPLLSTLAVGAAVLLVAGYLHPELFSALKL